MTFLSSLKNLLGTKKSSQPEPLEPSLTVRIHSDKVQRAVSEFTLSARYWTGYSIDKVEAILRHVGLLQPGYFYRDFNPDTNELMFSTNHWAHDAERLLKDVPGAPPNIVFFMADRAPKGSGDPLIMKEHTKPNALSPSDLKKLKERHE